MLVCITKKVKYDNPQEVFPSFELMFFTYLDINNYRTMYGFVSFISFTEQCVVFVRDNKYKQKFLMIVKNTYKINLSLKVFFSFLSHIKY